MHKVKSRYARKFDSSCKGWSSDRKLNLIFLRSCEQSANTMLKLHKYVFLRDVYEQLGIPISKSSLFVGWYCDDSNSFGDNYIDFGLPKTNKGNSPNVILDFNVDGDITNRFKD